MDPALTADWIGRSITVEVDRPLGSTHPRHPDIRYPVNYGYIPGSSAPDASTRRVPPGRRRTLEACRATVIALIRRRNDVEDKLVALPDGATAAGWDAEAIARAVEFQERFFDPVVEMPAPARPAKRP